MQRFEGLADPAVCEQIREFAGRVGEMIPSAAVEVTERDEQDFSYLDFASEIPAELRTRLYGSALLTDSHIAPMSLFADRETEGKAQFVHIAGRIVLPTPELATIGILPVFEVVQATFAQAQGLDGMYEGMVEAEKITLDHTANYQMRDKYPELIAKRNHTEAFEIFPSGRTSRKQGNNQELETAWDQGPDQITALVQDAEQLIHDGLESSKLGIHSV